MKFSILVVVICMNSCLADYNKQQMSQIMELARGCYLKLGIPKDSDMIERLTYRKNVTFSEQEVDLILCLQQDYGMYDAKGNLTPDKMVEFVMKSPKLDRAQVTEAISSCINNDLPLREKARKFYDCFFEIQKDWF